MYAQCIKYEVCMKYLYNKKVQIKYLIKDAAVKSFIGW